MKNTTTLNYENKNIFITKIKTFLKNETNNWNRLEIFWLFLASFIIIALSIYWQDTLMGIISSLTGVICVICTGKGKLSAYIFGFINCLLYAIISYKAGYYGETLLNAIYYVPMQFYGFYVWNKNMNETTHEVHKKHMKNWQRIILLVSIILGTYLFGLFLNLLGGNIPFIDAFTTSSSIIAMIVSIGMFAEQWWIWIGVDVVTVYMWFVNFQQGNENIATLIMWIVYLLNAIFMCYKWEKEANLVIGANN